MAEDDEQGPTPQEIEAFRRDEVLLHDDADAAGRDMYPRLFNLSAGPLFTAMVRAEAPQRPEYVTVSLPEPEHLEKVGTLAKWNLVWEAAQCRFFDPGCQPPLRMAT